MSLPTSLRLAGAAALTLALTACMDVTMTVDVLSETETETRVVTAVSADIYAMIEAQAEANAEEFCEGGEITFVSDIIECVVTYRGSFADLGFGGEEGAPEIEAVGDGRLRISFPTGDIADAVAEDAGAVGDPQMQAMVAAMFEGHNITMVVTGGAIVETNMEIAPDGQSARFAIPFTDLLAGEVDLPQTLYAVVQK